MRPFAVIRVRLMKRSFRQPRGGRIAAATPPSVENGCVCEPLSDDPQGAWRIDRTAYVAARKLQPCERVLFEVLPRLAEKHLDHHM